MKHPGLSSSFLAIMKRNRGREGGQSVTGCEVRKSGYVHVWKKAGITTSFALRRAREKDKIRARQEKTEGEKEEKARGSALDSK